MNWKALLNPARYGQKVKAIDSPGEIRSEFQRDYDRLIFSSPFRRLQNKTQVFPLPGSVFVHNRLTHSLEVASVGRSLGNRAYSLIEEYLEEEEKILVREIDTVVATACLAHDLGNPPFGHSGEKAISHFFSQKEGKILKDHLSDAQYADLISFEGNANLLRLLTHQFRGRRKGGYALTYASLGTIIKYPIDSIGGMEKKKFGYFQSENDTFLEIQSMLGIPCLDTQQQVFARHPLVYLMEAADDICYQVMDLEDAQKLNILDRKRVEALFMDFFSPEDDKPTLDKIHHTLQEVTDPNEQIAFLRAMVIGKLVSVSARVFADNYEDIMQGRFQEKLLKLIPAREKRALKNCEEVSFNEVYKHPTVVKIEISGYNVIGALLEEFFNAVMNPENDYSQKMLSLMPMQYMPQSDHVYDKARSVVDFVSGMTDVYAVDLFKQIKGHQL